MKKVKNCPECSKKLIKQASYKNGANWLCLPCELLVLVSELSIPKRHTQSLVYHLTGKLNDNR